MIPSQSQPRRIDLIIEECTTKYVGMPRYNGTTPKPPDAQRAGGMCVCIASFQSSTSVCTATCQRSRHVNWYRLQDRFHHRHRCYLRRRHRPTATMAFTRSISRFVHTMFSLKRERKLKKTCWQCTPWIVAMATWVSSSSAAAATKRSALDVG